ncbi:MAG: response regulator transcription factor [Anaerolineae bacterium]
MSKPLALIIEDQPNLAMLYEDALRLVGYDIFAIQDGLTALNHLATHDAPDLVILDVNLPSLSGRDILKHIRGSEKYTDTPVIILTANSLMVEQIRPHTTRNDYLYIKPISMKELQELAKAVKMGTDGKPAYMAETQKVPHLEPENHNTQTSAEDDSTSKPVPPLPTSNPVILRPDDTTFEDNMAKLKPQLEIRDHHAIITPADELIDETDENLT